MRPSSAFWYRLLLGSLIVPVALGGVIGLPFSLTPGPAPAAAQSAGVEVIVVLEDGVDPVQAAADLGYTVTHVYTDVFTGFAGVQTAAAATAARRSRLVENVTPDTPVSAQQNRQQKQQRDRKADRKQDKSITAERKKKRAKNRQKVPTGFSRIMTRDAWNGNNLKAVNADIAVLDTGIARWQNKKQDKQARTRDLNVRNAKNCVGRASPTRDQDGHGTHVAGTSAARNNRYGVVGIAPGARVWAVKVLDDLGNGRLSDVTCGLDWVFRNANTIDVANMSLAGLDNAPASTCTNSLSAFHLAICRVVTVANVPVVVAAGNQGQDADGYIPARYDEVITVGAFADSDGRPGGLGPACDGDGDDTMASYSNYGEAVDILAPGCRIRSTKARGGTRYESGTSMSAPHVAGALALYFSRHPTATADDARDWLRSDASILPSEDGGLRTPPSDTPNARVLLLAQ